MGSPTALYLDQVRGSGGLLHTASSDHRELPQVIPCYSKNKARSQVGAEVWVGGVNCDVSSPASVQRLADAAASQMGRIDVWVNNAGYSGTYQVGSRMSARLQWRASWMSRPVKAMKLQLVCSASSDEDPATTIAPRGTMRKRVGFGALLHLLLNVQLRGRGAQDAGIHGALDQVPVCNHAHETQDGAMRKPSAQ